MDDRPEGEHPHQPSPAHLDARLRAELRRQETILLDFDHTLFASNSTGLFITTSRPRAAVSLILALTMDFFPWHYFSMHKWARARDYATVLLIAVLLPWNLLLWRRRAPGLFERYVNHAITDGLDAVAADRIVLISFGFAFIIRPLLKGSRWDRCVLLALPAISPLRTLLRRKLATVRQLMPHLDLHRAMFVTDSQDDADLLDAVGHPYLIPPAGESVEPEFVIYSPLRYARLAKFNSEILLDQFVFTDFVVLMLATWTSAASVVGIITRLLLFVSLMAVYEIGYFENDMHAAGREKKPKLTPVVERFRGFDLPSKAWPCGLLTGLAGCLVLWPAAGFDATRISAVFALWCCLLAGIRAVYYAYNRMSETHRMTCYPVLQAAKYFAVPAVVGLSVPGLALLAAQALTMWTSYCVYRTGGSTARFQRDEFRLAAFLLLAAGLVICGAAAPVQDHVWLTLTIVAWCLWRIWRFVIRRRLVRLVRRVGLAAA
jgi:phosphoserine phosphatase